MKYKWGDKIIVTEGEFEGEVGIVLQSYKALTGYRVILRGRSYDAIHLEPEQFKLLGED